MNAWPPQASYPCGNFSDTSCSKLLKPKGSIGRAFAVRIRTENQDQASFCPFALREVSVLTELALGHLRYHLTDVPPQSNSPPGGVLGSSRPSNKFQIHAHSCLHTHTFRRRPPQSNCPPCTVPEPDNGPRLESQTNQGGISRLAPRKLAFTLQSLPPILHRLVQNSMQSYSKGSWGLSV